MRLKKYLTEKTFSISRDVNDIYKVAFKGFIDTIHKHNFDPDKLIEDKKFGNVFSKIYKGYSVIEFGEINGKELKSKDSRRAYEVNPVVINYGVFYDGNWYRPKEIENKILHTSKIFSTIQLSPSHDVLSLIMKSQVKHIKKEQLPMFYNSLKEDKIKGSISHELSHWISDSLYNRHIERILKKAYELNNREVIFLGKKDVNMTYFEIDAQIHSIKQLRQSHKKEWNEMTLEDIFENLPSLWTMAKVLYDKWGREIYKIWMKSLVKRMARENILGKNMRKYPDVSKT